MILQVPVEAHQFLISMLYFLSSVTLTHSLDSFELGALDFAGVKFVALCFVVIFFI